MSGIIISIAPKQYQRHLALGDVQGNFNHRIDNDEEAQASAEVFCKERTPDACQDFLEYLDQAGLARPRLAMEKLNWLTDEENARDSHESPGRHPG